MALKKELTATREERDNLHFQLQDKRKGNVNNSYSTGGDERHLRQQLSQKDSKIAEQNKVIQNLQQKLQEKMEQLGSNNNNNSRLNQSHANQRE